MTSSAQNHERKPGRWAGPPWRYRRFAAGERSGRELARRLYGAIIVLAVLITADDYERAPYGAAAILAVTAAVLLGMETYADVLASEITLRRPLTRAERSATARELVVVTGAAELPLLFLVLAGIGVVSPRLGFLLAKAATISELFYYGYVARRLAGRRPLRAAATGLAFASVGVALAFGKGYVHP